MGENGVVWEDQGNVEAVSIVLLYFILRHNYTIFLHVCMVAVLALM
jgi:hypothetical protein